MQDANESDTWHALPFEVTHGIVRTFVKHAADLADAKSELSKLLADDPDMTKAKTAKQAEKVINYKRVDKFIVMNKRTGQVATPDWCSRHLTAAEDGRPKMKNPKSTAKAWVLTLRIILEDQNMDLLLRTADQDAFRKVRCFELLSGVVNKQLDSFVEGYEHIFRDDDSDEQALFDEAIVTSLVHVS